jgi:hypothetical protein
MSNKNWGEWWGSNPRQPEPQSGALPTELHPPLFKLIGFNYTVSVVKIKKSSIFSSCAGW